MLGFGSDDGLVESIVGEDEAVDGDQLLAGGELGLVGEAAPADVADGAVGAELEAERVPDVRTSAAATAVGLDQSIQAVGGVILVDDLVAAAGDAVEVGVRIDEVDAVVDEGGPVILDDVC